MCVCRIYSDYCSDNTEHIIEDWIKKHGHEYGSVSFTMDSWNTGQKFPDELETEQWSSNHIAHVVEIREKALEFSREIEADYLLVSTFKNIPLSYSIGGVLSSKLRREMF